MASRNEQIAIDITAKDNASKVIDKIVKKIDGMEADEARITVTAETAKLEKQLDRARQKLEGLEGDEATVQARLIGTIEEDLEQANKLLEQLDGQTATVKIDSVGAKQGLDDIGKSANSSKSVLANMVGNATQDLGALAGAAGSTGVLIGQMGEYMADARFEGEKMGSVLRSFALVAGPAAALSAAIGILTNVMAENAARAKAAEARIKGLGKAMEGAGDDSEDLTAFLRDNTDELQNFDAAAGDFGSGLAEAFGPILRGVPLIGGVFGDMGKNFTDLIPIMSAAGLTLEDFVNEIQTGYNPMSDFAGALIEAEHAGKISTEQYDAMVQSLHTFKVSIDEATVVSDFMNASTDKGATAHKASADATDANRASLERHRDALDKAKDATDDLRRANEKLRDDLSNRGAYLDLMDSFDDVERAAKDAWYAAASGAENATSKARDHEQAEIDLKLELLDYIDALKGVPETTKSQLRLLVEKGELDAAKRDIEAIERNTIDVKFRTVQVGGPLRISKGGGGGNIITNESVTPTATVSPYGAPVATTTTTTTAPELVLPVRLQLPSATQISRQIGPLRLAVTAALTADRRLAGVRD